VLARKKFGSVTRLYSVRLTLHRSAFLVFPRKTLLEACDEAAHAGGNGLIRVKDLDRGDVVTNTIVVPGAAVTEGRVVSTSPLEGQLQNTK